MRIRNTTRSGPAKVELQMTPMIDIVFQLIAFFVMSLKIVSLEGDFNIKMPLAAAAGPSDITLPPIHVRLSAGPDGQLSGIRMGERELSSFADLHREIRTLVGGQTGPGSLAESAEVELDCDYRLAYRHVIDAITAVSGYTQDGRLIKLIDNIKFAPTRGDGQ